MSKNDEGIRSWSIEKLQELLKELEDKTPELRGNVEVANNAANIAKSTLNSHRRSIYIIKNQIRNKERFERK